MLDLAIDETVVIDDPSAPRSFADDEEESMRHVNVLGLWHRRTPDLSATACGIPFHSQFVGTRPAELKQAELMCTDCFTGHEMRRARDADARENE